MDEKTIFKISFVTIIVGLLFLYFYVDEISLEVVETIDTIEPTKLVKMKGTVSKIHTTDKAIFLTIQGSRVETTEIIFFPKEDVFLRKGHYVEIQGVVEEYRGKKEIIASEIIIK